MEPEERQEVEELLEFDENSAAGSMTTEFVLVATHATVAHAVQALRNFDGDPESVTEIYLLDEKRVLRGVVPLARLVMAQPDARLSVLAEPRTSCPPTWTRTSWPRCSISTTCTRCRWWISRPHGGRGPGRPRDQLPARKAVMGAKTPGAPESIFRPGNGRSPQPAPAGEWMG